MSQITIRIWDGCTVRYVFSITNNGSSSLGAVGGAGNSTKPDIELDPWAGLIVDHRVEYPSPVSTYGTDNKCPTCESPDPGFHRIEPQGGVINVCQDEFHEAE